MQGAKALASPCICAGLSESLLITNKSYIILCIGSFVYCKFRNFREKFVFATVLKDIFAMLKIRNKGIIYLYQSTTCRCA